MYHTCTGTEQKSEQDPYGTLPRILSDFCSVTVLLCTTSGHQSDCNCNQSTDSKFGWQQLGIPVFSSTSKSTWSLHCAERARFHLHIFTAIDHLLAYQFVTWTYFTVHT